MLYVKKERFTLESFTFESGATIPVQMGYETYGTLNKEKSNAILVCHYFSATGHAAGMYTEHDSQPGWWDGLIGPGKAIDTNKYFVICTDNICNVQVKNPYVITTGPATINPKTGAAYGMTFPVFTYLDVARLQYKLIEAMGITRLHTVIGPSAGGMIALNWAVHYPHMIERVVGVITNPQNPVMTTFNVLQNAIDTIMLDPNWNDGNYGEVGPVKGFQMAAKMMFANAYDAHYYETTFPRDCAIAPREDFFTLTSFEKMINEMTLQNITLADANSWMYTAKATILSDIAYGFSSLEEALQQIEARVLMIPCKQDILQPSRYNKEMVALLKKQGKHAEVYEIESVFGHMAGVFAVQLFEKKLHEFLTAESSSRVN